MVRLAKPEFGELSQVQLQSDGALIQRAVCTYLRSLRMMLMLMRRVHRGLSVCLCSTGGGGVTNELEL